MRTFALGKVAGVLMSAGLVLGLLGSGVGASFVWNGSSSEHITLANPVITFSAPCPVTAVTTSSGSVTCFVGDRPVNDGLPGYCDTCATIYPTHIAVTATLSGPKLAEPAKWTLSAGGPVNQAWTLAQLPQTFTFATSQTVYGYGGVYLTVAWNDLVIASLGDDFTINFAIAAYQ
jgi:hypothetical protein